MNDYYRLLAAASILSPMGSTVTPGGDTTGVKGKIWKTFGNHSIPDWWEWSHDPSTNDLFGVAERANGSDERYARISGLGDGTATNPWSIGQAKQAIDARSIGRNGKVWLVESGNYGNLGQFSGGGANGGWVTIIAAEGVDAKIEGDFDRYWSMESNNGSPSSHIQFVRLSCINNVLNDRLQNYASGRSLNAHPKYDNPQSNPPASTNDNMADVLGGSNPGIVGFQLDGWQSNVGPGVWVNCYAEGMGEGFGSYQSGNGFALGCIAYKSAFASPYGRSAMSLSWNNGGKTNGGNVEDLVTGDVDGESYFGGAFGCIFVFSVQLVCSRAIGGDNEMLDGNGGIVPTDGSDMRGKFIQQCNIAYIIGGGGSTGYGAARDGLKVVNLTNFACGLNKAHEDGDNPLGLVIDLVNGGNGGGMPYLHQRYGIGQLGGAFGETDINAVLTLSNSIGLHSDWSSTSLQTWGNKLDIRGRGSLFSSAPNIDFGSETVDPWDYLLVNRGSVIENEDPSLAFGDAHLKADSLAIGRGYRDELAFSVDFEGNDWPSRGVGRIDAGAIAAAA